MEKIKMDCNWLQSVSSVVVDKNSKRLYYTRKEKVIYDVRCRDEDVFFFFLPQLKSRWKWPCRLKITTTLKSWRVIYRHNTRKSRKTLPRRCDFFSSFHLSIPPLPIPFVFPSLFAFLFNPSSLLFHLPLFSLPPSINPLLPLSFPFHLTLSLSPPLFLCLSLFFFPPPFPFFSLLRFPSQLSTISPPSPTLQSFFPSSFPAFLPSFPLSVLLIPPKALQTVFLPTCHLVNRFSSFECKGLESTSKWNKRNTSFHVPDGLRLQKYSRIHKNRCPENDVSARAYS